MITSLNAESIIVVWIPAFAGMTKGKEGSRNDKKRSSNNYTCHSALDAESIINGGKNHCSMDSRLRGNDKRKRSRNDGKRIEITTCVIPHSMWNPFITVWIPAYAGMTKKEMGMTKTHVIPYLIRNPSSMVEQIIVVWIPAFAGMTKTRVIPHLMPNPSSMVEQIIIVWIPAYAGMTEGE